MGKKKAPVVELSQVTPDPYVAKPYQGCVVIYSDKHGHDHCAIVTEVNDSSVNLYVIPSCAAPHALTGIPYGVDPGNWSHLKAE